MPSPHCRHVAYLGPGRLRVPGIRPADHRHLVRSGPGRAAGAGAGASRAGDPTRAVTDPIPHLESPPMTVDRRSFLRLTANTTAASCTSTAFRAATRPRRRSPRSRLPTTSPRRCRRQLQQRRCRGLHAEHRGQCLPHRRTPESPGLTRAECRARLVAAQERPLYDFSVTAEELPGFERRFAGRVETGRHGLSDPAMEID